MKRTKLTTISIFAAFAGLLPSEALASGDIQAYLGDPLQGGRIQRFAEGTGQLLAAQPELRGIRLLPLDYNARLGVDEFLPQRPHYRDDIAGAGRIELPGALGVLYRFERVLPGVDGRFGFLRIDAAGVMQLIAERLGTGVLGADDPYGQRIALAPDSASFLVSTTVAAGGDLLEVDLLSGQIIDRSAALAPLDLRPQSLRLLDTWALAVAAEGVFRTGLAAPDQLTAVTFDGSTTHFSGEVAMSADSSRAVTTAGTDATTLHAWIVPASGAALRASRDTQPMTGAGYLPEALHGPFLAVSNDGELCAWRTEDAVSGEVFLRRSSAPPTQAAAHVTNSLNITDTLDEAGVLNMFQPGKLLMAVGEKGVDIGVGMEKVDFFEVSLDAAGVETLVNATGTSGEFAAPYLAIPTLGPEFMRWLPAAQAFFMYDDSSNGAGRLAAFDPTSSGVQTILSGVKDVLFVELVGDTLIVSLRMDSGNKPHRIVRLPADLSAAPTIEYDAGDAELVHPLVDSAGWIAFLEVPELGPQRLHRYQVQAAVLETFTLSPTSFGPVLAWSEGGDLAFSFDLNGLHYYGAWPRTVGAPYRLRAVSAQGALLPGR